MPFGIGALELVIIAVIVMLIFGVSKVGDIGGALGKSIREFRKSAMDDPREQGSESKDDKERKTIT